MRRVPPTFCAGEQKGEIHVGRPEMRLVLEWKTSIDDPANFPVLQLQRAILLQLQPARTRSG